MVVVRYIFTVLIPPVGVLLAGKYGHALLNVFFWFVFPIVGIIHAAYIVCDAEQERWKKGRATAIAAIPPPVPPPPRPSIAWDYPGAVQDTVALPIPAPPTATATLSAVRDRPPADPRYWLIFVGVCYVFGMQILIAYVSASREHAQRQKSVAPAPPDLNSPRRKTPPATQPQLEQPDPEAPSIPNTERT